MPCPKTILRQKPERVVARGINNLRRIFGTEKAPSGGRPRVGVLCILLISFDLAPQVGFEPTTLRLTAKGGMTAAVIGIERSCSP